MIFPRHVTLLRDALLEAPASVEAKPQTGIPKEASERFLTQYLKRRVGMPSQNNFVAWIPLIR